VDRKKNLFFYRNSVGVASVEFFWGLGFPIVLESTFLQLFLKNLGASGFLIGIVPAIFVFGTSCLPILASYLTRNIRFKKKIVLLVHVIPAIAILVLGLLMFFSKQDMILPLFFFFYTIFSLTLGFGIPIWLNFLARIFSEAKTVPGLGYMMLAQNIGKVISAFFILKIVEKYAFSPRSCALIFILTGIVFLVGAMFFLLTKEFPEKSDPQPDNSSFVNHTKNTFSEILRNKPFLIFLIADLDFYVIITALSFYANYATDYYGLDQALAAGGFVACIYAGSITVNILLGTLNLLPLKNKFVLSKCIALTTMVLLITAAGQWVFFLISFLLGMVRATRNMVYTPSVKKLSGKTDATGYFALAPILTAPIGFGFPLLFGSLLDTLSHLGPYSYKLLFAASAIFLLITFYFTLKTDYEPQSSATQ